MVYCNNFDKAIVTFKIGDKTERVKSLNPPITISCGIDTHPCGKKGTWHIDFVNPNGTDSYRDHGTTGFPFEGYETETFFFVGSPEPDSFDGNKYDFYARCQNTERVITYNFSMYSGLPTITAARFTPLPNNTQVLTIKDKDNQIVYLGAVDSCNYQVSCGDECPVGQIKIPTIEYPGYKCREKCPPETCCECDCGDVICCYGSNGQVLKTIPK